MTPEAFRTVLLDWYEARRRALPWRESNDLYRVWISEIMLQQTRVEAVVPYYCRFLERFPDVAALSAAAEPEVLAAWSGLGYYSRARNLHRAARLIAASGLPRTHEEVLALPGVGPYTAAAIASIALDLPFAAVDGNVVRVISRLTNNGSEITAPAVRRLFSDEAARLLDPRRPGDFNQAMMELGATVCLPGTPLCGACPVSTFCRARAAGTERELPVKRKAPKPREVALHLVLLRDGGRVFVMQRPAAERRLAGFWELPEKKLFPRLRARETGGFSHRIVNDRFRVRVWAAPVPARLPEGRWCDAAELWSVPLSTISRKALALKVK